MRNRVKNFVHEILELQVDIRTKIFMLLTFVGLSALVVALIIDILIGETFIEILVLLITMVATPLITMIAVRNNRVQTGALIISMGIVFMIVPAVFFFGGGVSGGGIMWCSFGYLYIGLTLIGAARTVMMSILTLIIIIQFIISYLNPDLIAFHSRTQNYIDLVLSLLLVGFSSYIMVQFQYRLYLREYTKAKEQAERIDAMNKAQSRFFSSMSHEIRTPINTIIGLNEMTLRSKADEEVIENARNIQSASNILLSLINDILDMSKIESGKMDIVMAQYDVGKLLSDIVNMIWVKAREKGLDFSISVDPSMPSQLFCDEVRLKQILINLLNNAVKYTEEGSVNLSVHCIRKGNGMVHVTYSVEDTGMGIRKENIPHLFDAFRREEEEKNRYIEGTGLGLSIVKQLVEILGGTVSVNSVYTKGSTFIVELDQEIADEKVIGEFDALKIHSSGAGYEYHQSFEAPDAKILAVDDNSSNLLVVKKLLGKTRVQLTLADSGAKCLELTLKNRYDIILMDHLMPGMDGIQCMKAVKDQAGGLSKEAAFVALTANAGSANQALYRREGFDEYLVKPVDPSDLEYMIQSLLPPNMVMRSTKGGEDYESNRIVREMKKKIPILVTTESMSDINPEILNRLNIPVIACRVRMEKGIFYDGKETGSDGLTRYMEESMIEAKSEAPSVKEYEEFFSDNLTRAQHIIHITTAKHASECFVNASEAALSFYNVRVLDSGRISTGAGLLALFACDMAEGGGYDPDEVEAMLEEKKEKIDFSFMLKNTEYLYRNGRMSRRLSILCSKLMIHPVIDTLDSRLHLSTLVTGNGIRAAERYVRHTFRDAGKIDTSVLFITHVGVKHEEIELIKEMVMKKADFKQIYITKTSPSIAVNCGNGTFGFIFARK